MFKSWFKLQSQLAFAPHCLEKNLWGKWHRIFTGQMFFQSLKWLCQSTEGNAKRRPIPVVWPHSFFIHHQTLFPYMLAVWRQYQFNIRLDTGTFWWWVFAGSQLHWYWQLKNKEKTPPQKPVSRWTWVSWLPRIDCLLSLVPWENLWLGNQEKTNAKCTKHEN